MIPYQLVHHFVKVAFVIDILEGMETEAQFGQMRNFIGREFVLEGESSECLAAFAVGASQGNVGVAVRGEVGEEGGVDCG